MVILIYALIGLYAVLTGVAGVVQLKEIGAGVRSLMFVAVSAFMLSVLWIEDKSSMLFLLIGAFLFLHILTAAEGMLANGRLRYRHHIIRFVFHSALIVLLYIFIV
ncbi:hypothetical protein ACQ0QQ_01935 [Lysinibacillus sphaericus]